MHVAHWSKCPLKSLPPLFKNNFTQAPLLRLLAVLHAIAPLLLGVVILDLCARAGAFTLSLHRRRVSKVQLIADATVLGGLPSTAVGSISHFSARQRPCGGVHSASFSIRSDAPAVMI
ncbi:hypothetical protein CC1G_02523 [Coprinopsis cinerea okayama7|uniref:Uncharacterized protein n=1 Tax=Coprinopsis cinerea (strain Okayama-7 / 130 / ATCC MYA-4618 / FGSC 9003) TaxID=240176 RepID=A8NBR3_COPC7|nr:hypothetical protein CC1G_02523 [Coprinopsis cinerea okayama7\|eukprot:XP_001832261.1 hypothetical protein CC1G_02523 [Coprinopsis cinerea okayama7\